MYIYEIVTSIYFFENFAIADTPKGATFICEKVEEGMADKICVLDLVGKPVWFATRYFDVLCD